MAAPSISEKDFETDLLSYRRPLFSRKKDRFGDKYSNDDELIWCVDSNVSEVQLRSRA